MNYLDKIKEATAYIQSKTSQKPTIGLVLGSGLGTMANQIQNPEKFVYADIPHFSVSTVEGHEGQLVIGELEGKTVLAMQGRLHFYEGYSMQEITFPVRVMKSLGIEKMIVTNACGGLNSDLYPGALMFIKDHINLMGTNPLIGENHKELGTRFPDMSQAYNKELIELGKATAKDLDIEMFEGIYSAITGPYYLSEAELKMVKTIGSDTIGMSTIPETIVAVHAGLKVLGISCVTDMADPEAELEPLTHEKVVEIANQARPKFIKLVSNIIARI